MTILQSIKKAFVKKPAKTTAVDTEIATRSSPSDIDAAREILVEIKGQLAGNPLPANLQLVSDEVFRRLPKDIRDMDTPQNRAEFAAVIQSGAVFMHRIMQWMESP